jgi:hypothetical protein
MESGINSLLKGEDMNNLPVDIGLIQLFKPDPVIQLFKPDPVI